MKITKKNKKKRGFKDFKKKKNVLKNWQREQENRRYAGLSLKRQPVDFPKAKKRNGNI